LFDNMKMGGGGEEEGEGGDDWDDYAMSGSENEDKFFKTGAAAKKGRKEA